MRWIVLGTGVALAIAGSLLVGRLERGSTSAEQAAAARQVQVAHQAKPIATRSAHGGRRVGVPILMYHVIADPPPAVGLPELFVRVEDFEGPVSRSSAITTTRYRSTPSRMPHTGAVPFLLA